MVNLRRLLARRPAADDTAVHPEASELRARALAHEADGRISEAIAAWTQLNRLQPDPQVEVHLIELRCEPAVNQPSGIAIEPWPRQIADPFPEVEGRVPEVDADQISMEMLGGAILHHGCLLVRGLLAPERVDAMRTTIDRVFEGRKAHVQGVPADETTPWYVPCAPWDARTPDRARNGRRYTDRGGSAVRACDSPRAIFQIAEALTASPVLPVISEYLGEPPVMSANKTMLRRVPPDAKPSWHQDGSFMGQRTRTVNVWIALSDCGEGREAPGIAILPRRLETSLRGEVSDGNITLTSSELEVASSGVGAIKPAFAPGDALLFDELLAHANGGGEPGLTRPRYAVETWLFAPTFLPNGYLPMALR